MRVFETVHWFQRLGGQPSSELAFTSWLCWLLMLGTFLTTHQIPEGLPSSGPGSLFVSSLRLSPTLEGKPID